MTGVTSDAAVASISAPPSLLQKDPLLTLILSIAPSHQIKIDQPKKSNSLSLTNASSDPASELTQRNAILRSICGMTFHNALDKHPFYLLGGHSASATASSESAICLASISSYMSIASSIRDSKDDLTSIYQGLNQVLMNNSFLVGSTPKPTLGDLDVFFAISTTSSENTITEDQVKGLVHFKRWLVATNAAVQEMIDDASSSSTSSNLPQVTLPTLDFKLNDSLPMFYFGDEDGIDDIQTQNASLPATVGGDAKKGAAAKGGAATAASGGGGGITEEQKKAAAEKRAKKNAAKASKKKQKPAASSAVTPAAATELNASAMDIRVGKIIEVWEHEGSDKLWCEKVDLGGEGDGDGDGEVRQILSGLRKFYKKEEMQDQLVLVLCNLKKRNLVGVPSHGMVLCATNADHTEVEFVSPPPGAKIGERVTFDGYDGPAEPENKFAKKKMLEKLAPDLKTDGDGIVVWKGVKSVTSAGPCIASKGMKGAQVS